MPTFAIKHFSGQSRQLKNPVKPEKLTNSGQFDDYF